jgi:hypothetical protein
MMAVQFFVVLLWYPETQGITLEDMQKKLGIACASVMPGQQSRSFPYF